MSVATDRLARYIAAETNILLGQEVRMDLGNGSYRMLRQTDLEQVRKAITELQSQVAAEESAAAGRPRVGGLGFALADLSGSR